MRLEGFQFGEWLVVKVFAANVRFVNLKVHFAQGVVSFFRGEAPEVWSRAIAAIQPFIDYSVLAGRFLDVPGLLCIFC
ncbi:hypothetical protein Nepgr_026983 [Nepenthes gracilis]|uniref:Uncharacterized protein n=1 Tax=Nepenthes gracilis TaxID=150966 RepID=A0AAD3Y2J5_NEPGR|nr:hypothetical protein Nepgr_026983 [Nepenthes gracilis]